MALAYAPGVRAVSICNLPCRHLAQDTREFTHCERASIRCSYPCLPGASGCIRKRAAWNYAKPQPTTPSLGAGGWDLRVSHPQRNALARRPSASVPARPIPSRIVPAANGPQLVAGNEQHVVLFAVDVVNFEQLRPHAALPWPNVNRTAVAVPDKDALPRLTPFPRRARAPAVRVLRAAGARALEDAPALDADSEHLVRDSKELGHTMMRPRPAVPTQAAVPREAGPSGST